LSKDDVPVLYQINNLNERGWLYFKLDSEEYSLFPYEHEVLLNPGSEFEIIEQVIEFSSQTLVLIIEFHEILKQKDKFKTSLELLKSYFSLIHSLVNIYVEIDELIKNNILHIDLDKNKIEINKDSVVYSEFVNDKTKILNIMSFIENTENDNEDDESSEDDESFEEDDDDDESSEEDDELDKDFKYYIVKSFSNDDNYFVRTDLKKCSCKSFEYCNSIIQTCKHIKLLEKCSEEELLSYPKTE
jgi:hypothetical protein